MGLDDESSNSEWCCSRGVIGKGTERRRLPRKCDATEKGQRGALFSETCILRCGPQQNSLGSVQQAELYISLSITSFERVERLKDLP